MNLPPNNMTGLDLTAAWLGDEAKPDVAVSSRVRLARNIRDLPFPDHANDEVRKQVMAMTRPVMLAAAKNRARWLTPETMSNAEKQMMTELRLATDKLVQGRSNSGIVVDEKGHLSAMINEEDHLRIQCIHPGPKIALAWKHAKFWDDWALQNLPVAFSHELGFLTACPTNLGTGMRASVALHLPALQMTEEMDKINRAAHKLGLTLRGVFGEGSEPLGYIYQLSNQSTLGESETEIIRRVEKTANHLTWAERNAREKMLCKHQIKLYDYVGRALGALRYARSIEIDEAMNHLGALRLGCCLNLVAHANIDAIDRLMLEIQPAHLKNTTASKSMHPQENRARADMLRYFFN